MRLSSLRIKNYGCLADFELKDIPPLAVFIGANGSGKSTLFDVFAFLRDCLRNDVTSAVDRRGGYEELHTRETEGPIELDLTAQTDHFDDLRILRYQLAITAQNGRPVIQAERLEEQIGANGQPVARLDPDDELGANSDAQSGDDEAGGLWQQVVQEERRRGRLALSSPFALRPAAGDGAPTFESYFAARLFHDMFTELHLSNVHIDAARQPPQFGRAAHLADDGANVALVTKYMSEEHDQVFTEVIARMQRAVPGLDRIDVKRTDDARIVLRFSDRSFQDPFLARSVSDGTVKLLAYLLLLYDPDPPPLLCIEEPENQL